MITAICMNPSFDKTVEVDSLVKGEVNRIRSARQDVGCKGINVAIVAKRLGLDVRCIGCAGRDGADKVTAALEREGIEHSFVQVEGAVRTNLKVVSRDGGGVTELNEPGAALSDKDREAFFAIARERERYSRPTSTRKPTRARISFKICLPISCCWLGSCISSK